MNFCILPFNLPKWIKIACKRIPNVFEYVSIPLVRVDVLKHVPDFVAAGELIC